MLFFPDLETIPLQRDDAMDRVMANLKPPGNYKKPEAIEKWWAESAPEEAEEKRRKMALNPWLQEIITIGWALNDGDVTVHQRTDKDSEADILREFFIALHAALVDEHGYNRQPTKWIGSNVMFEVYGLAAACVRNNVTPFLKLPVDAAPWSHNIVDLCQVVGGRQTLTSMDDVAYALGIDGKGDFNGSMVYDAWKDGEYEKIGAYCGADVERARRIYNRARVIL